MESRAVFEFFRLAKSLAITNPSSELDTALRQLNEVVVEEELAFVVKPDVTLENELKKLQDYQSLIVARFEKEDKSYQEKITRIDTALSFLSRSVNSVLDHRELHQFNDPAIYSELKIVILPDALDKSDTACSVSLFPRCHSAKTDGQSQESGSVTENFLAETFHHQRRLIAAKNEFKANAPALHDQQLQYDLAMAQKAIDQKRNKELNSVTRKTMSAVIDVYNKVSALLAVKQSYDNPLRPFMDRITCRERSYASAWYFKALGTPTRNKMFQAVKVEAAKVDVKLEEKRSEVTLSR